MSEEIAVIKNELKNLTKSMDKNSEVFVKCTDSISSSMERMTREIVTNSVKIIEMEKKIDDTQLGVVKVNSKVSKISETQATLKYRVPMWGGAAGMGAAVMYSKFPAFFVYLARMIGL